MDKKVVVNKKVIAIAIVVAVIIIALVAAIVLFIGNKDKAKTDKKSEPTAITAEGIVKEETYEGLTFHNIMLLKDADGYFHLTMDVTNNSGKSIDVEEVDIPLKDEKGKTVITLLGHLGDPMKAGETRSINASTKTDLSKVTTKSIEERK